MQFRTDVEHGKRIGGCLEHARTSLHAHFGLQLVEHIAKYDRYRQKRCETAASGPSEQRGKVWDSY